MYKNTDREIAIQETIMSAHGIDRVQKFAFELAKKRKRKKLTLKQTFGLELNPEWFDVVSIEFIWRYSFRHQKY